VKYSGKNIDVYWVNARILESTDVEEEEKPKTQSATG
jgi:hypothetical protein